MVALQHPDVRLIRNDDNLGFAQANNQAMGLANGNYVLLLNPDTTVRAGALDTLVTFLEEHPHAGAAGARLLNPDGSLQHSCSPAPTLFNEWLHLFHLDRERRQGMSAWNVEAAREVESLIGACLMLRREAIDEIGRLDERYFMYSEEVDYCYRLRKAGWPLYWVPQAVVVHYGGQSTRQIADEMFLQLYQNKLLYFRKHYGRADAWAYKFILLWASSMRLALSPFTWLEKPSRRRQHRDLAGRYWRLLTALPGL
jgi:GT2 family glycosyltransferase